MSLPILSRRFFNEHPPTREFFAAWKNSYPWSEKILPLYEWQNILYVGCLSLPQQLPKLKQQIVFVLCESEALAETWEVYNSFAKPRAHLPGAIPSASKPAKDDFFGELAESTKTSSANFPPTPGTQTGFDVLAKEYNVEAEASDDSEENIENLEEVDLEAESEEPEESETPQEELLNIEPEAKTTVTLTGLTQQTRSQPISTEILYKKPGALSSNKELAEASRVNIKAPVTTDKIVNDVFKETSHHFTKSMILLKSKDSVTPWKWDQNFENKTPQSSHYSLATPSPFRIVDRTQKSYHGYIVINEVIEQFFGEWNRSQVPEHLSIAPILLDDEVIGMLLAVGTKESDNKTSLILLEKTAAGLAKQFQKQPELFKVA